MQVSDTVKSIETLIGSLKDLKIGLNDTINSTNSNKLKNNVDSSTKTINALKKAMNFGAIYAGLRKGWSIIKDVATANIDMVETNNLFEVSMGKVLDQYGNLDEAQSKYYLKAMAFQNEMNEKLATNKAELQKYQAMYYSMFKSQGIAKDTSYLMSESLTKAGYDIASLYNLTVDDAMSKLKSGIAGQVEPLRRIGVDISESSLQKVLDTAGIDRSVQQLSYAEKEVARYIAIVNQAGQAQGDFARTMDNSANQIKIFKNQVAELKQVAGAFIINTFGSILVYVNAIIMVIKEILKSFAALFGYDLDLGGGVASLGGVSDTVDNIGSGLGKASKQAKEFKKQLLGFDEINNITPPATSGGSGGGGGAGGVGGIDSKLLNSLKEWDNKMQSISGKAQEIRDKMLDWLGFERDDNGGWKLKDGYTNFEKIVDAAQTLGLIFLGYKVSSAILTFLDKLDLLPSTVNPLRVGLSIGLAVGGAWLLYKGIKHMLEVDNMDGQSILEMLSGGALVSSGAGLMFKSPVALKFGLLLTFDVVLGISIGEWLAKYFDEQKQEIYGNKEKLNLGEMIYVGLNSIGKGFDENVFDLQPAIDFTAGVMMRVRDLGLYIETAYNILSTKISIWWGNNVEPWFTVERWAELGDNIKTGISDAWSGFKTWWSSTVGQWWDDNVKPWFTKEKWEELGHNMKTALSNKWNEFKDWWSNTAIVQWWNNNVAPWFTKEKWQETANNAKKGIEDKFTEWKNKFKPIEDWWNEKIVPWFTISKWKTKVDEGITGIKTSFTDWKSSFHPIRDWWNEKIAPWFTWEKWRNLAQGAVQGMQSAFSNFNFKIKTPHISWSSYGAQASGALRKILETLNLPTQLPKLSVSWYAKGGMPDVGEMFVARESGPEMVGRIGNKTTVANNDQIVTAIKQGVYEAVSNAMANGSNEVSLNITAEEGIIVRKAAKGFEQYVMQTGELPFPVPIG